MPRNTSSSADAQHTNQRPNETHTGVIQTDELEPIAPADAIEMYLADRKQELRQSSLRTHRSALGFFEEWCSQESITNLNDLSGRQLHQYRIWRREEATTKTDSLSKQSEKTQQDVIRQFIRYCETIDGVPRGLNETVRSPTIPDGEVARSDTVDAEQAQDVIQWLARYEYASLEHVVWSLLADTGARIGTIVALDTDDYRPNADPAHIRVRHRPETGTNLKNGDAGERLIALSSDVCAVVDDYLADKRPSVVDDQGRDALLVTTRGRVSRGTIRKYIYKLTRPCAIGQDCPHDRDPESCAATTNSQASKCPSSKSPHAIRRGYISHALSSGIDSSYVGQKVNASEEVLRTHYDARDEHDRLQVRSKEFDHAERDHDRYGGQ